MSLVLGVHMSLAIDGQVEGYQHDMLDLTEAVTKVFVCQEIVPKFLDKLTDEELKKESKTEAKNDALSSIIKALKQLVNRLPSQEETIKNLEIFRLKMILR